MKKHYWGKYQDNLILIKEWKNSSEQHLFKFANGFGASVCTSKFEKGWTVAVVLYPDITEDDFIMVGQYELNKKSKDVRTLLKRIKNMPQEAYDKLIFMKHQSEWDKLSIDYGKTILEGE